MFCAAKFGNFGVDGVKKSKCLGENVIFEIADPDLPIYYATFMGLRLMTNIFSSWYRP